MSRFNGLECSLQGNMPVNAPGAARILRLAKLVKSIRPLYILVVSVTAVQGVVLGFGAHGGHALCNGYFNDTPAP